MNPWKVSLPMFPAGPVLDNSQVVEAARCPRRYFYRYGLRRGFHGKNWAIQYGVAYHKYRETVENLMRERSCSMNDQVNQEAFEFATLDWEDPPVEHKHAHLDMTRLIQAIQQARARIEGEQSQHRISVLEPESSFDVELPFHLCLNCGWAFQGEKLSVNCERCFEGDLIPARHGGRIDQLVTFHSLGDALMIRDFKTTGYMPYNYTDKFEPNGQLQGYTWAGSQLSGRTFDGSLIETVYNTKTKGPVISQHYVTFSKGQQEQWLASMMMERQFIQTMWARTEELGYLAWPQRTETCPEMGGCPFRQPCKSGGVYELESWLENNTVYSEWDFTNPDKEVANEP